MDDHDENGEMHTSINELEVQPEQIRSDSKT